MKNFGIDAYTPREIAARIEKASASKASTDPLRILTLAVLAGAFIGFGCVFFTAITSQAAGIHPGLLRVLGGLVFCLGLILVVVAGAELFTGNNLLAMAYVDQKISLRQLLQNWLLAFTGNFAGALGLVGLIFLSGHWSDDHWAIGGRALAIANAKVNLDFWPAFVRGMLCNILVCLAIWLCYAGHSVTDKVLAIVFPITAFVALGFEHSVANMYLIPAGLLLAKNADALNALQAATTLPDLGNLTVRGFLLRNLLPVTLGNIVGGSGLVALVYWFVYGRPDEQSGTD